ncbi:hypothetical protein QE429_003028 [Bacillus sp. SORGH_AS 510]|uniref:hypothetical protein n=1 Tax=Bacillus sp. SORGH_AS_0510 TaxID=3041771 RepID=UPI00278784E3|nr:hypothetical protein [Bacillus sp. SORGH_AS_0510]MDQ1146201.1 hypothetical protein [Bacillus sp. SORGH_AS_0510]
MENQLNDLSILTSYRNRQVILNYYQDEDFLWRRDGFHFESIQLENEQLMFSKPDGDNVFTISLKKYGRAIRDTQFPNYFILLCCGERLGIYFP